MNSFIITVKGAGYYNGYDVFINGQHAYHRPYDGSGEENVTAEASKALGELLREKLGHPEAYLGDGDDWDDDA